VPVADDLEPLEGAALDAALESAIYGFDADRLQRVIEQCSVDPSHRIGGLTDGMPLLRVALDAEWERGVSDDSYVPVGDCVVALIELGADPNATYLGTTTLHELASAPAFALLRHRVEVALRGQSESA
jgi:hypothetical protein